MPVHILAVDDLRLLRIQHQLAGRKAVSNRAPECPRLLGAVAVTDDVVRVHSRTQCAGAAAPSTCRTRSGGTGLTGLRAWTRSPHPAASLPYARLCCCPPSAQRFLTSARHRATPTGCMHRQGRAVPAEHPDNFEGKDRRPQQRRVPASWICRAWLARSISKTKPNCIASPRTTAPNSRGTTSKPSHRAASTRHKGS
jgi:hypothetical protein